MRAIDTGVPAVDLFAPSPWRGTTGIVGPAGTGRSTLLHRLLARFAFTNVPVVYCALGAPREWFDAFAYEMEWAGQSGEVPAVIVVTAQRDDAALMRWMAPVTGARRAADLSRATGGPVRLVIDDRRVSIDAAREVATLTGRPVALPWSWPDDTGLTVYEVLRASPHELGDEVRVLNDDGAAVVRHKGDRDAAPRALLQHDRPL